MSETTITLRLREASNEQLRAALSEAYTHALVCEQQGQHLHTWRARAADIEEELLRRRDA